MVGHLGFCWLVLIVLKVASGLLNENEVVGENRSSKFFPLFSIVRVTNYPCIAEIPDSTGTCFTKSQCNSANGLASGTCANGFGVCCVVTVSCDSIVTQNNTNFKNRDDPSGFKPNGLEICNVRVQKPSEKICQLRLDFTSMNLAGADGQGQCMIDRLSVNGVTSAPSNLCGSLSGQHLYLDYGSSDRITVSVITDGAGDGLNRNWNIRMTYIECNSLARAPDGCLQYFMSATGEVRMLAYPMAPHLADLDYTVCIRTEDGSGSISWTPCAGEPPASSFLMTDAASTTGTFAPGAECNDDYVLIMTDEVMTPAVAIPKMHDRYCGNGLKATAPQMVRSIGKPFIMRVRTNEEEPTADVMNTGFCLAFRQEPPRRQ